jgi:uncharacterized protein YbjT (DUF2867 family)
MLLTTEEYSRIVTLTRRPLHPEITNTPGAAEKLEQHVIDFERLREHAALVRADQIVCALGTTLETAGSRQQFRHVDYDYSLLLAQLGLEQGARHFLLVSALGANPRSLIFYNRVKGELEEAILALPYRSITIVRPSLLVGTRTRPRRAEELVKRLAFLVPARYKPIPVSCVATTLVREATKDEPGHRTIESSQMWRYA